MSLPSGLRVILVHDWLTGMRGGERVLEEFCRLFPQAPLYTLVHQPGRVSPLIEKRAIHCSLLQRMPGGVRHYRHYLPLMPLAIERLRLPPCDLVLSSSHAVAKGIHPPPGALHVSYVHAPMRYMWAGFDDYFAPGKASLLVRAAAHTLRPWLQRWDRRSAARVQRIIVNSAYIRGQVHTCWGREAQVIHPPVSVERFTPLAPKEPRGDYFLMVGAFAPNKRVADAIRACTALGLPLRIAGSGPEEAHCRALAGPTVQFLGEVDDAEVARLYRRARAFLFPGRDDFGITPLEAQASGTPVIAWAAGGALETVTPETGLLYQTPGPEGMADALRRFLAISSRFTVAACVEQAARFGRERFREEISAALVEAWQHHLAAHRPRAHQNA